MARNRPISLNPRQMLILLACAAAIVCGLCPACRKHQPSPSNVNIVIFLIDALRPDRLGAYGYSKPTSPCIDALAAESVLFEQAYSPAPWTLPSVTSMLTSTFPCEHGVLVNGQKIADDVEPLASRLKKLRYVTCLFSANPFAGSMSGLDRGHDRIKMVRQTNDNVLEPWLRDSPTSPFYFFIHNVEPHDPFLAPPPLVQLFDSSAESVKQKFHMLSKAYRHLTRVDFKANQPLGTTDNTAQQRRMLEMFDELKPQIEVLYDAAVRDADAQLGSVIRLLKDRELWDNTLFIVTADHGEEMSDHGGWQHDQSVYEELVRVPLIIHFPDARYAGRSVKDVVSLVDLMPTIFDYLKRPELTAGLRGKSLMPCLQGRSLYGPNEFVIPAMRMNKKKYYRPYKETRGDINIVVRQGRWKGIFNAELNSTELYDLTADPGEKLDLSARHPELAGAIQNHARAWLSTCASRAKKAAESEVMDEETRQRLRSLGYVD